MRTFLMVILVGLLAGCASVFDGIAYKLPTRQGNVIEQKQLDQLKLGMTPEQVRFLLGTPLAASPYNDDRWDYVGYYKGPRGQVSSRTVSLFFEAGKIVRMEGLQLAAAGRDTAQALETPDVQSVIDSDARNRLDDERAKQPATASTPPTLPGDTGAPK